MSRAKEKMDDSPTPNLGGSSDPPSLSVPKHSKRKLLGTLKWIRLVALHPVSPTRSVRAQMEMMTTRVRKTREILSRSTADESGREFPSQASARPGKKQKKRGESSEPRQQPTRRSPRIAEQKESKDRQLELSLTTTVQLDTDPNLTE